MAEKRSIRTSTSTDEPTEEETARMRENFSKAGKVAASVLHEVPKLVLPGESYLDIAESLEKMIMDAGGKARLPGQHLRKRHRCALHPGGGQRASHRRE